MNPMYLVLNTKSVAASVGPLINAFYPFYSRNGVSWLLMCSDPRDMQKKINISVLYCNAQFM